jgi:signal transduction histidine kinase
MNIRRWLLSALVLAVSQLLFWAMVTVAERQSRPADLSSRPYVEFQVLDKKGEPVENGRRFKAMYEGTSGYRVDADVEGETDFFSILFQVEDKDQQLALFMAIRENLKEVKVNGITVQPDVPLSELQGPVTSEPAYFLLPKNVLQQGVNVLYISKDHEGMVSALPEFSIGPAKELAQSYRWKNRYLVDIPLAGVAILAFTIALCLAVNWPQNDRPRMRWLIGFLASSMLFTLTLTFNPLSEQLPLSVSGGMVIGFQIVIALTMAKYVAFDVVASRKVHRAINWAVGLATIILGGAFAASFWSDAWFEIALPFAVWRSFTFNVLMTIPCILILCWSIASGKRDRWLERMVVIVCLSTFAMDRLSSSVDLYSPFDPTLPISLYWSPIVGPLLGMGMIFSLARQASEARRTVAQSNEILAAKLTEQNAELSRSYDAQKQMLQRQVMLEERQRIVRDMHDGIGGQLLGLMMQVRQGGVEKKQVEEGLQSSIADLRLIVDSMDSADDGLAETLRSFEHRVRAQVEAAGMTFTVEHGLKDGEPGPGPRPTLQILRILQEAVTNAMRHSGGTEISLASHMNDDGMIHISIRDNGTGLPEEIKGGRGLTSMRSRASAVGGSLKIDSSDGGTVLSLIIPGPA